jgi:hypothetical protein
MLGDVKRLFAAIGVVLWFCPHALAAFAVFMATSVPTCWVPGSDGWTVICSNSGAGGQIYYVSATGNDQGGANNCQTVGSPCATPAHGWAQMRSGQADWLLLKCGDKFTDLDIGEIGNFSGLSATQPALVAGYDPSNPTVPDPPSCTNHPEMDISSSSTPSNSACLSSAQSQSNSVSYLAIIGVRCYAYLRDPANGATDSGATIIPLNFGYVGAITWLLIEDCELDFGSDNLDITPKPPSSSSSTIMIRRNVITNAYSTTQVSNGITLDAPPNSSVVENVLDHNGWNASVSGAGSSVFKHQIYAGGRGVDGQNSTTNSPLTVTGNIFSNGGAGQSYGRAGGTVTGNLFVASSFAWLFQNPNAFASTFQNNVISEGLLTGTIDAQCFAVGNFSSGGPSNGDPAYNNNQINAGTTSVSGNICANSASTGGIGFQILNGQNGITVSGNYLYKWNSGTPSNDLVQTTHGIYSTSITNAGTGYTDLSMAIGSAAPSSDGYNNIVVAVPSSSSVHNQGWVYVSNGIGLVYAKPTDGTHIELFNTNCTTQCTAAGTATLYYPYYQASLSCVSCANGASATGATADIISSGGQIVEVVLYGSDTNQILSDDPGQNYTVNDLLNATIPGGSNFQTKVTAVDVNTASTGTNSFDPTGTNSFGWPSPTDTVATYDGTQGGPGTIADYVANAKLLTKQAWLTKWTAKAAINYIRVSGFGLSPI